MTSAGGASSAARSQPRLDALHVVSEIARPRVIEGGEHFLAVARGGVDVLMERLQRAVEEPRAIAVEARMPVTVDQRRRDESSPHILHPIGRDLTARLSGGTAARSATDLTV